MKTSKVLVFDIKRFAVHDGYGLRTTVFFKGCPLRCVWCQNPEGLSFEKTPLYFENSCIHCKRCEKFSQENQMEYKNNRPYFNYSYKNDFDNLIKFCPTGAIRYDSKEYTAEELLLKIKEDKVFFRDEGGVTFSGGEPLMQSDFLLEILKKCKEENISTAIETSFCAPIETIKKIIPYLDLIYIDLKIFDEKLHEKFTGVSSKLIKENIKYILENKYREKVIIRTPLIPNITAFENNLKNIANFISNIYKDVKYELLNYNPLASAKYPLVNIEFSLDKNLKMFDKEQMKKFYDIVYSAGIKNLIIE